METVIIANVGSATLGGKAGNVEVNSIFNRTVAPADLPKEMPAGTTHLILNTGSATVLESAEILKSVTTFS